MSHDHPVIPFTLARQMIAPDILRQVLVYVTTPTLTTCLRVCRDFYRVGAPLLYRHVRFFNDGPSFEEGVLIVSKGVATRSGPRVENLKAGLYRYIRTVSIVSPESPYIHKGWLGEVIDEVTMFPMPQLETVRVRYLDAPLKSAACRACWSQYQSDYGCEYGSSLTHYLLINFAARKLVFLHYQGPPVHPSHRRLIELEPVETLTLVIYPDCFTDLLALTMGRMHWIHLPTFRNIFCSFDQEDLWAFRSERHMSPEDTFIHMVFCATYDTYSRSAEIYLIGDVMPQTLEARRGKLLLSKARVAELFDTYAALRYEELRTPMSERAKVVFKDRRDYLEEGVMDEIDAEELARWKRTQDFEDRMESLDDYREQALAQRKDEAGILYHQSNLVSQAQLIEEYRVAAFAALQDWEQDCVQAETMAQKLAKVNVICDVVGDLWYHNPPKPYMLHIARDFQTDSRKVISDLYSTTTLRLERKSSWTLPRRPTG